MELILYVVRNKEGKYFRAKGYGGYGQTWVDDINKCKLYTKLGQARSRVTFFSKNYPTYGRPEIIELSAQIKGVLPEQERVDKVLAKMKKIEEEREIRTAKRKFKEAEEAVIEAQKRLQNLRGKNG